MREEDLYGPLKAYLEAQGYTVKAEIGACDVMALRGDEPALVVEMKLTFSLALVMQGVARQSMFDDVYLAVPVSGKTGWKLRYRDIIGLCRRLGLGLLAVGPDGVEAHLDPAPYAPRKNVRRAGQLLREFHRRVGDPNRGGTSKVKRMTAYRQDALRCAVVLEAGPTKASAVAAAAGVVRAGAMLRDDHYGWFERVALGIYALTGKGRAEVAAAGADRAALGLTPVGEGGQGPGVAAKEGAAKEGAGEPVSGASETGERGAGNLVTGGQEAGEEIAVQGGGVKGDSAPETPGKTAAGARAVGPLEGQPRAPKRSVRPSAGTPRPRAPQR